MYETKATSTNQGHIIYVIDASGSMSNALEGKPKIDHVNQALQSSIIEMINRSRTGDLFKSRYRVAMIAYNDIPLDLLGGFINITDVAEKGFPQFSATESTNTRSALIMARDLLSGVLPNIQHCPAPLICHLTDGRFTTEDPEPVAREIMQMRVNDGNVLIENIYLGDDLTKATIPDSKAWRGLENETELKDDYARKLFRMSSPVPDSFASVVYDEGYQFTAGRRMIIPGTEPELIQLAFTMSTATGVVPV